MGEAKAKAAARAKAREKARLERTIPENLDRPDLGERTIREESIKAIHAVPALMDHVELLESVMDHIDFHAVLPPQDLDQETIQLLGARLFNSMASAYGQLIRGYYQVAAQILRDVMEVTFLLRMFDHDRSQITRWRAADARTLKKDFKPIAVRLFLEGYDEWQGGNRRAAVYEMFCEYAAHATWKGFTLMGPTGGGKRTIGPFFDAPLMKAILEEMAQLVSQAGNNYASFFANAHSVPALETELRRLEVTSEWAERYIGRKRHPNEFDDLKRMLAELKKHANR